ncbi:MAG: hypothetical protein DRI75_06000 [Bacteroidetes bacterium]|nr:MAG: hypothetical protein DRI75_06000 [Bacteroidota bacterium]
MKNPIKFITVIFSVLVLFSCKKNESYSTIQSKQAKTELTVHKIVINEVLDGGNYTYLNVDESGNKYWLAIPYTSVKVGETHYYDGGIVMKDFESKELKRTFDFITFSEGIRTTEKLIATKQENPHSNSNASSIVETIKIEKPENGTSLEELFSNKESFSKKTIIVKGKVIKVNSDIMEKNWVHISDGTQYEGKKSLTITTTETVKVGDIVTFEGTIILNKDFGQGYIYGILLEQGQLKL